MPTTASTSTRTSPVEPFESPALQRRVSALSGRQHGMIALDQIRSLGLSRSAGRHLVNSRRFEMVAPGVLHATGAPDSARSRAMAAVLAAGETAVVSHGSAAALWDIPGFQLEPLHLTVVRTNNPLPVRLATVHRQRSLARVPSTRVDGIPVVRPEVLVIQLCARMHPDRAARILDRTWSQRLLSGPSLARVLASIDTRGLAGVGLVRTLLEARGPGYVPPASGLEMRAAEVIRRAGLAPLERQVDLGDDAHWCGRVDLFDRDLGIVLEIDSEKYHTALVDREHDRRRHDRLEAAGFIVGRVTDLQVWHRPQEVVEMVRSLRRTARRTRPTR